MVGLDPAAHIAAACIELLVEGLDRLVVRGSIPGAGRMDVLESTRFSQARLDRQLDVEGYFWRTRVVERRRPPDT